MGFAVLLHPKAAKALEKIEKSMRTRIKVKLKEPSDNPEKLESL